MHQRVAKYDPPMTDATLGTEDVRSLEAFLEFRGESKTLKGRIRSLEDAIEGHGGYQALDSARASGVNDALLSGALVAKTLAA